MGAGAASGLGYAVGVEPRWVAVRRVAVVLPRLPAAFEGYRVVHLSDLHMSHAGEKEPFLEAMALVAREKPDLVAITGDFVTHHPERIAPKLAEVLRAWKGARWCGGGAGQPRSLD